MTIISSRFRYNLDASIYVVNNYNIHIAYYAIPAHNLGMYTIIKRKNTEHRRNLLSV